MSEKSRKMRHPPHLYYDGMEVRYRKDHLIICEECGETTWWTESFDGLCEQCHLGERG